MEKSEPEKDIHSSNDIKPVSDNELPAEFLWWEKPFGRDQHHLTRLIEGSALISMVYYYGYLLPFGIVSPWTFLAVLVYGYASGLGITVGCHRYWTHKTFKANKPLQIILMVLQTMAYQYPIFKWCRDHRVHHKYTDTNADPHNSKRGFLFSHVTWLVLPKHPDLEEALRTIDISDLARDPIVRFQSRHYWKIALLTVYLIPVVGLRWLFPELTWFQIVIITYARIGITHHFTFLVNSVAHMWGDTPYDKGITARDNKLVSLLAVGEGWHNYHHTFPWDYKAAEFGFKINLSTLFIHFFAWIGWAWDMKTVSHSLLVDRINRTGDGSHPLHNKDYETNQNEPSYEKAASTPTSCWGWGDKELRKEDIEITETVFPGKSRRL